MTEFEAVIRLRLENEDPDLSDLSFQQAAVVASESAEAAEEAKADAHDAEVSEVRRVGDGGEDDG